MADSVASEAFLASLKSVYSTQSPDSENPWFIVAAVAFSSSNFPEAVPLVFQHAFQDISGDSKSAEALLLVRKIKDAIFKSGLISGFPKAINSLIALHKILPAELKDTQPLRDLSRSTADLEKAGKESFEQTYGDTADSVQSLLDSVYPDLGYFSNTIGYGYVYSCGDVLSPMETSFILVAALIAADTPRQIDWHLQGAIRNGATPLEVKAIRKISIKVARAAGVTWRDEIPDLPLGGTYYD